jgi:4-hydroxybenzoyl-CoA thioesterase
MRGWRVRKLVRFSHCDPAGIVYYPRYFDLLHEAKEDWLREHVGVPLPELIGTRRRGLPIVSLAADFVAPSKLGDEIDVAVRIARVGGASLHLDYDVHCHGERRMGARTVLVHIDLDTSRALRFDDALRARLEAIAQEDAP